VDNTNDNIKVRIVEANVSLSEADPETWHYLPDGSYTVEVQVGTDQGLKMVKVVRVVGGAWNRVVFTFPHRPFLPKLMVVFVLICVVSCSAAAVACVCTKKKLPSLPGRLALNPAAAADIAGKCGWRSKTNKKKARPSYKGFQPLATKDDNLFIDVDDDEDEEEDIELIENCGYGLAPTKIYQDAEDSDQNKDDSFMHVKTSDLN